MLFVKNLKQVNKNDSDLAGGKGASLGEMIQAGIAVPPGFVILSTTFEKFLEAGNLNLKIKSILDAVDYESNFLVEQASKKIKSLILKTDIPQNISNEIKTSFEELNTEFVAVRSSATVEDSSTTTWAGQLDSYLNTAENNLLENVKKCWASLYTMRAIIYRFQNSLLKHKIAVAVVVQKMIQAEISGICFTVHPVTEDYNQMIIEAGYGLGEAIVSGMITPDTYLVEKNRANLEFVIVDKNILNQKKMIIKSKNGNKEESISDSKSYSQKLSDKKIIELAKVCLNIENHYGKPQDIEWASEKGKLYIVQSRPITTLKNNGQSNSLLKYVKTREWFFGIKAEESLLFYSSKQDGYRKYVKKEHGVEFAENLLVSLKNDYPIRVLSVIGAESFYEVSEKRIIKNPKVLQAYVEKDDQLWEKILKLVDDLIKATIEKDYQKSEYLFKEMFNIYELSRSYFVIIFSLGLKLAENKTKLKNVEEIMQHHDHWRNSLAFKEERMGEAAFYFLKLLIENNDLKFEPLDLMKYLTLREVNSFLERKLTNKEIEHIITSRKRHGCIYLNLEGMNQEIIDDQKQVKEIQNYFLRLETENNDQEDNDSLISGQVTYRIDKKIKGQVVVIKDKRELEEKGRLLKDKILIAIQTTPHYISYLNDVKAIITDEGGVTCHAAIISRELKKPCIVGTKIATKVLKDGDLVEIDVNNGTLKILKQAASNS